MTSIPRGIGWLTLWAGCAMAHWDTGPAFGVGREQDGSGLLINQSSLHKDLGLLTQSQVIQQSPHASPLPRVQVSGVMESSFTQIEHSDGGVDFSGSEVDVAAQVSPRVHGFTSWRYDENDWDRFALHLGFITWGPWDTVPVYVSMGQMYWPFGVYSTRLVPSPWVKKLGRVRAHTLKVGYFQEGWVAESFVSQGISRLGAHSRLDKWGWHINRHVSQPDGGYTVGIGYTNHLGDAEALQRVVRSDDDAPAFGDASAPLAHFVPGVDGFLRVDKGPVYLLAEWLGAVRDFDPDDMRYQQRGARPSASHVEAGYRTAWHDHALVWSVSRDASHEALGYRLPALRYTAGVGLHVTRNTLLGLAYAIAQDDGRSDDPVSAEVSGLSGTITGTGALKRTWSLQCNVYF